MQVSPIMLSRRSSIWSQIRSRQNRIYSSWCEADIPEVSWCGGKTLVISWWGADLPAVWWYGTDTRVISLWGADLLVAVSWCGSDTLVISWWGADTPTFNSEQTHLFSPGEEQTHLHSIWSRHSCYQLVRSWPTDCSQLVWIRHTCNHLVRRRHAYIQFEADTLVISWWGADTNTFNLEQTHLLSAG
jgi:hypothetical protein